MRSRCVDIPSNNVTPADYDITVIQGHPYTRTIVAKDSAQVVVDLTGWTAHAHVRRRRDTDLVIDLAPEITAALSGEITIALTADQTSGLTPGQYGWDLVLVNADGVRDGPYVGGAFTVTRTYTHLTAA